MERTSDRSWWSWLSLHEKCEEDSIFTAYECFNNEHTNFVISITKSLYDTLESIPFLIFLLFSLSIGIRLTKVPALLLPVLSVIMLLSIVLTLIIFLIFWGGFSGHRDVAGSFFWRLCKIWTIISLPVVGFYFPTPKFWGFQRSRKFLEWIISTRDDMYNGFDFEISFPDPPSGSIHPNDTRGELWMKQFLKEEMDRRHARQDEKNRTIEAEKLRQRIKDEEVEFHLKGLNSRETHNQRFRRQLGRGLDPPLVLRDSATGHRRESLAGIFRATGPLTPSTSRATRETGQDNRRRWVNDEGELRDRKQKTNKVMTADKGTQTGPTDLAIHKETTKSRPEGYVDHGVQTDIAELSVLEEPRVPVIEPQPDPAKYEPELSKWQQSRPPPGPAARQTQRRMPNPEPTFPMDSLKTKRAKETSSEGGEGRSGPEPTSNSNVAVVSKDTAKTKEPSTAPVPIPVAFSPTPIPTSKPGLDPVRTPVTGTPVSSSIEPIESAITPTTALSTPPLTVLTTLAEPSRETSKKIGGPHRPPGRFIPSRAKPKLHFKSSRGFGAKKSLEQSVKKNEDKWLKYAETNSRKPSTVNTSGVRQVNSTTTSSNTSLSLSEPISSEPSHLPLIGYQPSIPNARGEATPEETSQPQANLNQAVSIPTSSTQSSSASSRVQPNKAPAEPLNPVKTSQLFSSDGPDCSSYARNITDRLVDLFRGLSIDESDEDIHDNSLDGHNDAEYYPLERMEVSLDPPARGTAPRDSDKEMSDGSETGSAKDVDMSQEEVIVPPINDIEMSDSSLWRPNEEEEARIREVAYELMEDLLDHDDDGVTEAPEPEHIEQLLNQQRNFGEAEFQAGSPDLIQSPILDSPRLGSQISNGSSGTQHPVSQSSFSQSSTNSNQQNLLLPFPKPKLPTAPPAINFVWGQPAQPPANQNEFTQPSGSPEVTDYPLLLQSEDEERERMVEEAFLEDQEETTQNFENTQSQLQQPLGSVTQPSISEEKRQPNDPDPPKLATAEQLSQRRIKKAVSRKHKNSSAQEHLSQSVSQRESSRHHQQTTQKQPARVPDSQASDVAEMDEVARNLLTLAASDGILVRGNASTQGISLAQETATLETNAQGPATQNNRIQESKTQEPISSTHKAEEKPTARHSVTSDASSQRPQNSPTSVQPVPAQPSPTQRTQDHPTTTQQVSANNLPLQPDPNITQPKQTDTPVQTGGLIIPTDNPITSSLVAVTQHKTLLNSTLPTGAGLGDAQQQQDVAPIQRGGLMFPGGNPTMHNSSAVTAPTASQNAGPDPQKIEEFKRKQEAQKKARAKAKAKAKSEGPRMFHPPRRNNASVPSTPAKPHHNLSSSTQEPSSSSASEGDALLESFFGPPGSGRRQGSLTILEAGQIPEHLKDAVAKDKN